MDDITEMLWSTQVDILYDFNPVPICTGTVLSSYVILTLASCLANRSLMKLTIQTQADFNSEEDKNKGVETRYIDSFYPVQPRGQNSSSESDLAVILLEQELTWSKHGVKNAKLPGVNDTYSKIYQPYRCFDSEDPEERWPVKVKERNNVYPVCMNHSTRRLTPPGCILDTTREGPGSFMCEVPALGTALFCESKADQKYHLCGVLQSYNLSKNGTNYPVFINTNHYLHGIFLEKFDEELEDEEADDGTADFNLAQNSFGETRKVDINVEPIPYQLSLQKIIGGVANHKCGAILIDERTVLSAAHCFPQVKRGEKHNVGGWKLVGGMGQINGTHKPNEQTRTLQKIITHPGWKTGNLLGGYDIALLVVNEPFLFTGYVKSIWISSPDEPVLSNYKGTATGWGKTSNEGESSNDLMAVEMQLLSYKACKKLNPSFNERLLCTNDGKSNVCQGDSGGPLVIKNYEYPDGLKRDLLVGITSFAPQTCEDLKLLNGFTKVSSYYDWIINHWERNTTSQTTFTCFDGRQIIKRDWRCDDEFDCDDGSDEKGCFHNEISDTSRPKTQGCGGDITLEDERDIIYLVPKQVKASTVTQCIWTIYNTKSNPMQVTLLPNIEAQFHPTQHQLIILHNFTRYQFNYQNINETGSTRKIPNTFATLIFRGRGGIPDGGFHLRLKSLRRSPERERDNALSLKRQDLIPTLAAQNYVYPSNESPGANERIFTYLTPSKPGSRIKLNVNFEGMQLQNDWLEIISIGNQPKSLFRVTERRESTSQFVVGEMDETLLVFMSTASITLNQSSLQFSYYEESQQQLQQLQQQQQPENATIDIPHQNILCGGKIDSDQNQDLVYTNSSKRSCIWIIFNVGGGSVLLSLVNKPNPIFNMADSSLYILHNFNRRNSAVQQLKEFGRDYKVDQPFFVLSYRASPISTSTGFYLKLRRPDPISNSSSTPSTSNVQHINLTPRLDQAQEFSYSVNGSQMLGTSCSALISIQPTDNDRKVYINLTRIHLANAEEEWIQILSFRNQPVSVYRTSGIKSMRDKVFIGTEGEPLIIYLKIACNSSLNEEQVEQSSSIKFTYSEQQEIVKPINSCGGVINVGREQMISYGAPPNRTSYCLWIVYNHHGHHFKISPRFNTSNSQLTMLQNKNVINMESDEFDITQSRVTALFLRSNGSGEEEGGRRLLVKLEGQAGYEDKTNSLRVKTITIPSTSAQVEEFLYPPPPAISYENNEHLFILINGTETGTGIGAAGGTGNKIQLNLTFVDMEPNFDELEIYTYKQSRRKDWNLHLQIALDGLRFWRNKMFLGDPGQPFLLYFHSDSSTVKSGFKFNFTTISSD